MFEVSIFKKYLEETLKVERMSRLIILVSWLSINGTDNFLLANYYFIILLLIFITARVFIRVERLYSINYLLYDIRCLTGQFILSE